MNQKNTDIAAALAAPVSAWAPQVNYALLCAQHLREGKWTPNILQNEVGARDNAANELERLHAENQTLQAGYDAARLEIASLQARVQEVGNAARENRSRTVVDLEVQISKLQFAIECYEKDIAAIKAALPADKYNSKDWREGCTLERIQWLHDMYACAKEENDRLMADVLSLQSMLDAVGAGGVESQLVPVRQPLTADQINDCAEKIGDGTMSLGEAFVRFARAIEVCHGITSETGCGACGNGCESRGSCRLADESPSPTNKESLMAENKTTEAAIGAIYSNGKHGVIVRHSPSGYFLEQHPYNGLVYAPWFASLKDVDAFLADHGFVRIEERADLHGTMSGELREGPVIIVLKDSAVAAHMAIAKIQGGAA